MPNVVRYVVRKFWGVCAALLIALAVLVQLGREFSTTLGSYREDLAHYLSNTLGMPVELDELSGEWSGMLPALGVGGFKVKTTEGESVFTIERAVAKLDLLNSLLERRLVWGDLQLKQVQASFEQDEEGSWGVKGAPVSTAVDGGDQGIGAIDDLFDVFLLGPHIEFGDTQISFNFYSGHSSQLVVPKILLENTDDFHRLRLNVDVDERLDAVTLVLEGEGDPRDRDSFNARGYLKIQQFPTEKAMALVAGKHWQGLPDNAWRSDGGLDLEAWLSSLPGGGFDLEGSMALTGLPLQQDEEQVPLERIESQLSGYWKPGRDWRLGLQDIQILWGGELVPALDLSVASRGNGNPLKIQATQLDLADWHNKFAASGMLKGKLAEVLESLSPKGLLHNLSFTLPTENPKGWRLQANLDQVSVQAWKGAPALSQVDGYVEAHAKGGFVELDSRDGFSMHYPLVYTNPMIYDSAKGQVAWSLQPDNNAIYVNSGRIRFNGEDGTATGLLYLYLPWVKDSADPELYLQIGLQNSQAKYYKKYVPFTVDEGLRLWLDRSLGEGKVLDGGFIYRGSLKKGAAEKRTAQLYLNITEAELNYHPEWPGLRELDGLLTVDDVNVNARVDKGKLYNSDVGRTLIVVAPNPMGKGSLLGVRGQVSGNAADGLRVLRESMLRKTLGDTFDLWQMSGDMVADITLSVPLVADARGAQQHVKVDLKNTDLAMDNLRLSVEQLKGHIEYSNLKGLTADHLSGRLWKRPVVVDISSPVNPKGGQDALLNIRGKASTEKLALWTQRPELYFTHGELAYVGQLRIPSKQSKADYTALLNVSSNMRGVAIELPAPFGKKAEESIPLQVRVPLGLRETLYDIRFGHLAHGVFVADEGQFQKGVVALGSRPVLPQENALAVTGRVKDLELGTWQSVWGRYGDYEQRLQEALVESGYKTEEDDRVQGSFTQSVDLVIDRFLLGNYALEALTVKGERTQDRWQLEAESPMAVGRVTVFDDAERPLILDLDYLSLPAEDLPTVAKSVVGDSEANIEGSVDAEKMAVASEVVPEGSTAAASVTTIPEADKAIIQPLGTDTVSAPVDPLGDVDLSQLVAVDFRTKEFRLGDQSYGQWSFQLRPHEEGLEAKNVQALIRGTRISGKQEGEGAHLLWRQLEGVNHTHFKGRFSAGDLSQVMEKWQQPKFLESRSAIFDSNLSWEGSPAKMSMSSLQGDLTMDVRKGRFIRSASAGSSAFLRLISLLNFDTLARRLKLDFSDVYKSGMAYDRIQARMRFERGSLYLSDQLQVKTPSSKLQLAGTIDLEGETMDTILVATLPVGENLTLLTALAAGLPAAAGVYVASKLFSKQVDKVASVSYSMNGPWADPDIKFEKMFDNKSAKKTAKTTRQAVDKARQESDTKQNGSNSPEK